VNLTGYIKDISVSGLGLEVDPRNHSLVSHGVDDMFYLSFVLPNEKQMEVLGKVVHVTKRRESMRLGMVFPETSDSMAEIKKTLGFFLLRP
jgi:hypothetical protein